MEVGVKGKPMGCKSKGGKRQGRNSTRSFVLRTYVVGGMGVRELHIDWWVKVVPASTRRMLLPKCRYVWEFFPR